MAVNYVINPFTKKLDAILNPDEAITHTALSDMPDVGGTNADHDARYYTETEADNNFQPKDADLTSIAGLGYSSLSFLKKTAANTWALDTNVYLTAESDPLSWSKASDQTLLTGDKSGSFDIVTSGSGTFGSGGALTFVAGGALGSFIATGSGRIDVGDLAITDNPCNIFLGDTVAGGSVVPYWIINHALPNLSITSNDPAATTIKLGTALDIITANGNLTTTGTVQAEHLVSTDDADINDNLTVGDIIIDEAAGVISFTGATSGQVKTTVGDLYIENDASDKDIIFKVNDGGVDTTLMTMDGSVSRVGIGVTAPGGKLDIQDGADFQQLWIKGTHSARSGGIKLINDNDKDAFISILGSAFGTESQRNALQITNYDGANGILFGKGNFTPQLIITDAGLVGIGDLAPEATLDIRNGSAVASVPTLRFTSNSGTWTGILDMGGVDFYTKDTSGSGAGIIGGIRCINNAGTTAPFSSLGFYVTGSTRGYTLASPQMFIDRLGNVGIGVGTTPLGKLHVATTDTYPMYLGATTDATTKYGFQIATQYASTAEPEGYMAFGAFGGDTYNNIYFGGGSASFNAATNLNFLTAADITTRSGTNRLKIVSDGEIQVLQDLVAGAAGCLSFGAAQDAYIGFDGNSLNIVANAVTATDALELTGGYVKQTGGLLGTITTVTTTYTVLYTDQTVIGNSTTAFTITMPTATVGQIFEISNINTGSVTVDGASSDTIDGQANIVLSQWDSVRLQCYAANSWKIK